MLLNNSPQWLSTINIQKLGKVDKSLMTSILSENKKNLMLLDISCQWPLNILIYTKT